MVRIFSWTMWTDSLGQNPIAKNNIIKEHNSDHIKTEDLEKRVKDLERIIKDTNNIH